MKASLWSVESGWEIFDYETHRPEFEKRGIRIHETARIGDGASIGNGARIGDGASIGYRASIGDRASIGYRASIGDRASIKEKERWVSCGPLGSRNAYTTYNASQDKVWCGCFSGTLSEFEAKVEETHGKTEHGLEYKAVIVFFKSIKEGKK